MKQMQKYKSEVALELKHNLDVHMKWLLKFQVGFACVPRFGVC